MRTKRTRYLAVLLTPLFFLGCSHVTREGIMQRALEKTSSFEEINEKDSQLPEGYSELVIKVSIKIPPKEVYLIKTRPPRDENSQYLFVLNINGQGVLWMVNCTLDKQKTYINHKRNPEGGEGLICRLEKRIRLRSGSYRVYLGLPEEEFATEVSISLLDSSSNVLEFKPIYWQSGRRPRAFWRGISRFDIFLNGKPCLIHSTKSGSIKEPFQHLSSLLLPSHNFTY